MPTIHVAKAFTVALEGLKLSFPVGEWRVDQEIADHWFVRAHLVGAPVPPEEQRTVPPESVPPITGELTKELKEELELIVLPAKVPPWAWEQLAQVLTDLRLHGATAHVIGPRPLEQAVVRDARKLRGSLDQLLRQIRPDAERVEATDLPSTEKSLTAPDGFHLRRVGAPGDLATAVRVADAARHDALLRERQRVDDVLLPLVDPRRAPTGGHHWRAPWQAAAHVVWLYAEKMFRTLDIPTGRHDDSTFIQFVAVAVRYLGFEVNEATLSRWATRHKAIL